MADRIVWAALHLLDHQLIDRDGYFAGNVDDVEIEKGRGKTWYVTALHSGPGALATRLGHRTLGAWLERIHTAADDDVIRPIPFDCVVDLDSAVKVDASCDDMPTSATERWVRQHVIGHIPGVNRAVK